MNFKKNRLQIPQDSEAIQQALRAKLELMGDSDTAPIFRIRSRESVLILALQFIESIGPGKRFQVQLERGIDCGGPTKTFCTLLCYQMRLWPGFKGIYYCSL